MAHTPRFGGRRGRGKKVFDLQANPRVLRLQKAFQFKANELKTVRNRIDQAFRRHERELFKSEGSSGGNPWPELSDRYKEWKNKHARGKKIMVLGMRPLRSARTSLTTKKEGHVAVYRVGPPPLIVVGTRDFLPSWHIRPGAPPRSVKGGSGLRRYNKNMPHRDTLAHRPKDMLVYPRIWREYIVNVKLPRMRRSLDAAMKNLMKAKRI